LNYATKEKNYAARRWQHRKHSDLNSPEIGFFINLDRFEINDRSASGDHSFVEAFHHHG
jgi:hypothetical protein